MTAGVLIFAFNNTEIDYVSIAAYAAKQAKHYLGLPVTVVTNQLDIADKNIFDSVVYCEDNSTQVKRFHNSENFKTAIWHNASRSNAFDLSPYDETLVIDSDFIINSDFLKYSWQQSEEFLIYDNSIDLASHRDTSEFRTIGDVGIKFYWATVFFFRKTKRVELFFRILDHIKSNWGYYAGLYQLPSFKYRNDYAFSIAINILDGGSVDSNFSVYPNKLIYITDRDIFLDHTNNRMQFLIQKKDTVGDFTAVSTENLDIHVMSKYSLMEVIKNK